MSPTVLVTGATGLLGSEIVRLLLSRGDSVRILRRSTSKLDLLASNATQVEHFEGDVTDRGAVEAAMRGVKRVYHVAARIGYGLRREEEQIMKTNVKGTAVVVNAAIHAGVERLVHTSSVAALGKPESPGDMITEATEWMDSRVNSTYGKSKRLAELEVYRGIAEGLDAVIVNPSMIFGVGRPGEGTREVIDRVRFRKLPGVPVGGNMAVDVVDTAQGHLVAMERGRTGERYIFGSENLSWKQLITIIADAFDVRPPILTINPTLGLGLAAIIETVSYILPFDPLVTRANIRQSARTYAYDNTKARTELGCVFRPFRDTMERVAAELG